MAVSKKAGTAHKTPVEKKEPLVNLPLFFKDPQPLHPDRHAKAGLNALADFSLSAATNSIALNMVEFFDAARSYPIVFTTAGKTMPVALLGIHEINCFLDEKNHWLERCYVPAYLRRYPFIFMEDRENNRFILCVDEGAPNYTSGNPEKRFFDDTGEMSEFCRQALQFCGLYQQHYMQTAAFCEALVQQNLLVEKSSMIRLPDGRELSLSGFRMLDAERFGNLPDDVYLDWRKKGWIAAVDAILVSYANWKYLAELVGKKA